MKLLYIRAKRAILVIIVIVYATSCKKFLEVDPPTNQLSTQKVYKDSVSTLSAFNGLYGGLVSGPSGWIGNTAVIGSLASDELNLVTGGFQDFSTNNLQTNNTDLGAMWSGLYQNIYQCNAIIEGVETSDGIAETARQKYIGEAKFLRAYFYFYLTNFFGKVPLVLTTDITTTASLGQSSTAEIYEAILADLRFAQASLPETYYGSDRLRPNKWMATAFLAKVLLYTKNYNGAETEATKVIGSGVYTPLPSLSGAFLKTSKEVLWQLKSVNPVYASLDGYNFTPNSPGIIPQYSFRDTFLNAFEAGDQRKTAWIGTNTVALQKFYYPAKYKVMSIAGGSAPTELQILMRVAEVYLIRAEARAQNPAKLQDAISDLNVLRDRAGLAGLPVNLSQADVITSVAHERQVELFAEDGNRWFDLVRTAQAGPVLSSVKGTNWQSTDILFPIPANEILRNPKLNQNDGYR